jgi:hypothetical protein
MLTIVWLSRGVVKAKRIKILELHIDSDSGMQKLETIILKLIFRLIGEVLIFLFFLLFFFQSGRSPH